MVVRRAWGIGAALALALAGCGRLESCRSERARGANRQFTSPGAPRLAPGEIPEGSPRLAPELAEGPTLAELPDAAPGLIVLVVLDTVRADHLAACGYGRPTSPSIDKLVSLGATLSCRAYAPSTWTLPSHATFFTGAPVERHGMLRKGVALPEDLPTVAEQLAKRGYQTLLVSANPLLKKPTGLTRGFHRMQVSQGLVGPYRARGLAKIVRYELAQIDPRRPLFVTVNVFDAHEPYPAIPPGTAWASAQAPVYFHDPTTKGRDSYARFAAGEMDGSERDAWLADVVDGYDQGVLTADAGLGEILALFERHGLTKHGVRLVVTSDHGENLAEHGTLRHDGPPWEGVARVPLLFHDTEHPGSVAFPEPVSAAVVASLLLDGKLPDPLPQVQSGSIHYGTADARLADALALWPAGTRKLWWRPEGTRALDLATDPGEQGGGAPRPDEETALRAAGAALLEAKERALSKPVDAKMGQLLEKLGYVEPE